MSQVDNLEHKIDELVRALGGIERLRELARLSSLDHLVNLHLLSHLTKLDKIEGLDKLKQLDQLQELHKLDGLKIMEKLDQLSQLSELKNLSHMSELSKLSELQEMQSLKELKQLEALGQLDKLSELRRLDALGSLQNLGGLERLDHLKYLENLDRLNELTALTKLDALVGLGELLEKHADKFAKLRYLEALDNLPLLDQLKNLDKLEKLDRLDELSRLDELKQLAQLTEAPPAMPAPAAAPAPEPSIVFTPTRKSWRDHALSFGFDLFRTIIVAALLVGFLLLPQGRKVTEQAVAFLGFGEGHQVNWALQVLAQSSPETFPQYWSDFQRRLESESQLIFDLRAPWSLQQRYEKLYGLLSYDFNYKGMSLRDQTKRDLEQRLLDVEAKWRERLILEIGQVMLRQNDNQKLALWNQLKDMAVGGRWEDLLKISRSTPEDKFAKEGGVIALVHLQLSDPDDLAKIMESSP